MTLLSELNFDEASGAIIDYSGLSHGFTPSGNVARTAAAGGHTDKGLTMSGTGVGAGPTIFGQTTARTMMMWAQMPADFTGWFGGEYHRNTGDTGMWGGLCLSGSIGFRAKSAADATAFASMTRPADGLWHHYAGTFDGTSTRLYYGGVLQGSAVSLGTTIGTADSLNTFNISSGTTPIIDDFRIFDTALTQAEIASWMNIPAGTSAATKIYFSTGAQASGVYEKTAGGLVQRNSFIIK